MRLLWFLDFVYEMVHYLREHPDVLLVSRNQGIGHVTEGGSRGVRLGSERSTQHVRAKRIPHRRGGVPIAGHFHDEDFGGFDAAASRCAVGGMREQHEVHFGQAVGATEDGGDGGAAFFCL